MQPPVLVALVAGAIAGLVTGVVLLAGSRTEVGPAAAGAPPSPPAGHAAAPPTPAMVLEPVFEILDCDREGLIDRGQVDEHFGQLFAPRDLNRSHTLDVDEYVRGTAGAQRRRFSVAFAAADRDESGELTSDEFIDHLYRLVDQADADGDGSVTVAELVATRSSADVPVLSQARPSSR